MSKPVCKLQCFLLILFVQSFLRHKYIVSVLIFVDEKVKKAKNISKLRCHDKNYSIETIDKKSQFRDIDVP